MDTINPDVAHIFRAKEQRRRVLAALPYCEKVRMVVQLQRMVAPLLRQRGRAVRVWDIA